MKHRTITIITTITSVLLLLIMVQGTLDQEIQRVTQQIEPQLRNHEPVFENIITTVYHTVQSNDFQEWTTNAANQYDTTTNLGWCVIPQSQRGFYEDIKCQGSGVHQGRVYQHNTIQTNPEQSQPIEEKYTTGRTATQTNPKTKWTIAVNNQPNTPCYIPYGTLLYIEFEPGNPWNGLYRAEDTGSAFRGECKIDIYAGVGLQASKEAEQHVSGKTPKIYVLEPNVDNPPQSLSPTQLAETYKIMTQQEYVSKHGSAVITTRYIPQLSQEQKQIGELILPYSSLNQIIGLKNFYDTVKQFSNEVLLLCSNIPTNQRLACAYNKAKEYENKIIINHCSENTATPKSNTYLKRNQTINISGIIKKQTYEETNQKRYLILELEQLRAENLTIKIETGIPALILGDAQINEYVTILNTKTKNITDKIEIEIESMNQIIFPEKENQLIKENTQHIALSASDCTTTNNTCLCEIKTLKTNQEIKIQENKIITEQEETRINAEFKTQNTQIKQTITALQVLQEPTQTLNNNPRFKKEENQLILIQEKNEELPRCEPKKTHAIFCAKPAQGQSYFEQTYYPEMNFALKI